MKPVKYSYQLIIALLLLLSGCGSQDSKVVLLKDSLIVAFGDSLTKGIGTSLENSYPAVLENELGIRVVNEGMPGETSAEGLLRLKAVLERHRPTLVILCHGGNDILRKLPRESLKNNLSQMVELIHSYGSDVLLVGVPEPAISLSALPLYADVAEQYLLVSELNALPDLLESPNMKSDRVHLNTQGYRQLALALSAKIDVIH